MAANRTANVTWHGDIATGGGTIDAKIVILEENESFVGRTGYVNELRKIVTTP